MTSIQLLGGATLRRGGAPVSGPAAQRHRVALLALVTATWPQALGRDRAMALLWPEAEPEKARRLLNLAVHVLRRALGEGMIVSAGDGLLFEPRGVSCDLHAFRSAVDDGRDDDAAAAWTGPLLDGFHLGDAPEFHYWLDERRAELARTWEAVLLRRAERQREAGDAAGLVETCRSLTVADPYSGPHARALMVALDAAGDRAGALRHARQHEARMRADLELEPDTGTVELTRRLLAQEIIPAAAPPVTPRAAPTLAVMMDGDDVALAAAVRERLVAHLLESASVRVTAADATLLRLSQHVTSREAPTAVVDANVTAAGGRLTVRLRLFDAVSGTFLLSTRLEQPAGWIDLLAAGAAEMVIAALASPLAAQPRVSADGDVDEARMLCAKGQHFCARREESALLRAIQCFTQARTLAPTYAAAYTGLANAYAILGFYDLLPPREAFSLARQAAQTARALDPADPECHAALGYIAKYYDWQWSTAEQELLDAISLDPRNQLAHQWFGNYLALREHAADSVASMKRAVRLAPQSAIATAAAGWAHYFAGDPAQAVDYCHAASELDPQLPVAHAWLAQASLELGRCDDAVAALRRGVALSPTSTAMEAALAHALARAGARDEARSILRRLSTVGRERYVPPYEVAKVHLALGDTPRALRYLEQARRDRSHSMGFLRVDHELAPLRDNPRFHRLLARTGHR